MDVRKQKTIPVIVLMLLLSATSVFAAYQQIEISPEKKKALRKFDPVDIVPEARGNEPEARESKRDRDRKKSKQNAGPPASAAPISDAVVRAASPPATSVAQSTLSPRATPSLASQAKSVTAQSVAAMTQSSEPTVSGPLALATTVKQSVHATGLSLPVIFLLFGLVVLALVAVAARLKKDLRRP